MDPECRILLLYRARNRQGVVMGEAAFCWLRAVALVPAVAISNVT